VSFALEFPDELVESIARRAAEFVSPPALSPYMTTEQAADYLACGVKRIYKLVSSGRLVPYREGGRLLFLRTDVEGLVEQPGLDRPPKADLPSPRQIKCPRTAPTAGGRH
jgi:excisionase family DNA binding protein